MSDSYPTSGTHYIPDEKREREAWAKRLAEDAYERRLDGDGFPAWHRSFGSVGRVSLDGYARDVFPQPGMPLD
jgi:hypothetical protein